MGGGGGPTEAEVLGVLVVSLAAPLDVFDLLDQLVGVLRPVGHHRLLALEALADVKTRLVLGVVHLDDLLDQLVFVYS